MTINTQYEVGDTVYYLEDKNIKQAIITNVHFSTGRTYRITYSLAKIPGPIEEESLYSTKEEVAMAWLKAQGLVLNLVQEETK